MEKNRLSIQAKYLSLSAVLFFSPFVYLSLKKDTRQLSNEEKNFIFSWCKVWNWSWVLLFLILWLLGLSKCIDLSILIVFAELLGYLLLVFLGVGSSLVLSGEVFQALKIEQSPLQKKQMLLSFLPVYSDRAWFSKKQFEKPYRWSKEAQLRRFFIFLALLLSPSVLFGEMIILLLIIRVGLLFFGYDILSQEQKIRLHHLFKIYPEESFSFLLMQIQKFFNPQLRKNLVDHYQNNYNLWMTKKGKIINFLSYLILLGLFCFWIWYGRLRWKGIFLVWILIRFLILKKNKLPIPKVPIIAEYTTSWSDF